MTRCSLGRLSACALPPVLALVLILVAVGAPALAAAEGTTQTRAASQHLSSAGGLPTHLSVSWPTTSQVPIGRAVRVTGTVSGLYPFNDGRSVHLQHHTNEGWQRLRSTTTTNGTFALTVPTSWSTRHSLRVVVPPSFVHSSATSLRKDLKVAPTHRPAGKSQHYALTGWRLDPCQTIRYRLNVEQAPRGAVRDAHRALRMVGEATGLTFAYVGTTKVVPYRGHDGDGSPRPPSIPNADFLVGWATPAQVPALRGDVAGLGGMQGGVGSDAKGFHRAVSGQVVIDSTHDVPGGFGKGSTRGEILLHEIGHAVGLEHALRQHQIMSYNILAVDRFGAGDLNGLRKVGRSAGCFDDS